MTKRNEEKCKHTKYPEGYIQWHAWAEKKAKDIIDVDNGVFIPLKKKDIRARYKLSVNPKKIYKNAE